MKTNVDLSQGRYLLFLDILGFSELVDTKGPKEIYSIIDNALKTFGRWEELNGLFKTIYFSDTFLFYQEPKGYSSWAFLDIYAIGGMVLSALLAAGVPARGAISFGEFEVNFDSTGRHHVYFGKALIEAYKAEQREKWIGITIMPSAWKPFEAEKPGIIDAFAREKVWLKREDGVLLLNPFIKLRSWYLVGSEVGLVPVTVVAICENHVGFIQRQAHKHSRRGKAGPPTVLQVFPHPFGLPSQHSLSRLKPENPNSPISARFRPEGSSARRLQT